MHNVDDMYRLLLERERAFQDKTQEIFGNIDYLTDAIIAHLAVDPKDIGWISLDMIGREIIVMVSVPITDPQLYVEPGTTPAELLTIALPTSVVDTCETELILQYLEETFDIRKYDGKDDIDGDLTGIVHAAPTTRRTVH